MVSPPRGPDLSQQDTWPGQPLGLVPVPTLTNPLLLRKRPACPKGPNSMGVHGEVSSDPPPRALAIRTSSVVLSQEGTPHVPKDCRKAPNTHCQEETWSLLCGCAHAPFTPLYTRRPPNPTSACGNQRHLLAALRNVRLQTILSAHCSEH